jgi:hypothetical protein
MQLILAIDSDPRRSEQLAALVRTARLTVDLVQATSAGEGLHALRDRVPDLILTSPLLSPFDDGVLDEYLRDLGTAATHVQTVRIPMLSAPSKKKSGARSLFGLGRKKKPTSAAAPDGCDPTIFADEIAHYLACSAEQRAATGKPPATKRLEADAAAVAPSIDQWGPADAVVEEFRAPIQVEPEPVATSFVYEETHVPGAILDLRTPPVVHAPEPPRVVEPEPPFDFARGEPFDFAQGEEVFVEPETPAYMEPVLETVVETPVYVAPDVPVYVAPEPIVVPEPVIAPEPIIRSEPIVAPAPPVVNRPAAQTAAPGTNSASFEAALAAIRAAWVKPEDKKKEPAPPNGAVNGRPKTLGVGSGDVDLTRAIDALEEVAIDGQAPAASEEPSPDESKAPGARDRNDKAKKRPEKVRPRKMRGPDGRDEWGVFDPNQCGFSALVDKLDEVTDDEVTGTDANANAR